MTAAAPISGDVLPHEPNMLDSYNDMHAVSGKPSKKTRRDGMFKVVRVHPEAQMPKRGSSGAAGYDLYTVTDGIIEPGRTMRFRTGLKMMFPREHYGRIAARSSYGIKGIIIPADVIDGDYRGEVEVMLHNTSEEEFEVKIGERIAQIVLERIITPEVIEIAEEELTTTKRGDGGFGSTGKR